MKEFVMKKRMELEEVCKSVYLELDVNIVVEKFIVVIDLGIESCYRLRLFICVIVCVF